MGNVLRRGTVPPPVPVSSSVVSGRKKDKDGSRGRASKEEDVQLPPLVVLKDGCTQTTLTLTSKPKEPSLFLNKLVVVLLLLLSAYFGLVYVLITSHYAQSLFVYLNVIRYPGGDLTDLARFGLVSARNINVTTADGLVLRGYHLLAPGSAANAAAELLATSTSSSVIESFFDQQLVESERIVLYFHGNSANRAFFYRINMMKQLAAVMNASVIAVDYRGFGDSQGWPSEEGTHLDAKAILAWVEGKVYGEEGFDSENCLAFSENSDVTCRRRNRARVYLYGHSMGTAVSVALAADVGKHRPDSLSGVILDAPFTTLGDASLSHPITAPFRIFPFVAKLMKKHLHFRYATTEKIGLVVAPILIVHGVDDDKVPPEFGRTLYHTALAHDASNIAQGIKAPPTSSNVPKVQLVEIPRARHSDCFHYPLWTKTIANFVEATSY